MDANQSPSGLATSLRRREKLGGWYKRKSYAHFDLPLPYEAAERRVTSPAFVAQHASWPLIGYTDQTRRFRTRDGQIVVQTKERPIKYCAHLDGYIFSYYAMLASQAYEKRLKGSAISPCVIGYRAGLGTNVHFARDVFEEICRRSTCSVLCFDIKSFFDHLDHSRLKSNLEKVLGVSRLGDDWFAVYKAATRFSFVEYEELQQALGFSDADPPRPLTASRVFREKVRGGGLIKTNDLSHGVPQGSSLSAIFSNIVMLDFDDAMVVATSMRGAYYRRYSDDIVIVCDSTSRSYFSALVEAEVTKMGGGMGISPDKTETSNFLMAGESLVCDRPVTYLGFTFDGGRVLLRGRTLSRYYRRMTYAVRHALRDMRAAGATSVFKRQLYREFTHLGKKNFYSYTDRASALLADNSPRKQLRRHVEILHRKITNEGR